MSSQTNPTKLFFVFNSTNVGITFAKLLNHFYTNVGKIRFKELVGFGSNYCQNV